MARGGAVCSALCLDGGRAVWHSLADNACAGQENKWRKKMTVTIEIEALVMGSTHPKLVGADKKVLWLAGLSKEQVEERLENWLVASEEHDIEPEIVPTGKQFLEDLLKDGSLKTAHSIYYLQGWAGTLTYQPTASELREMILQDIASGNVGAVGDDVE
jgi:hypothetical protein